MASNASEPRPLIGLTTYLEQTRFGVWDTPAAVLHKAYLDSVWLAGGNPVLLPPGGDWRAETIGWLDGLVLTGGADVDPARYGQEPHPLTGAPRHSRDQAEIDLCTAALKLNLPVLGVCRGAQVLNVALGGTLHQHVTGHNPQPGVFATTDIEVVPDSVLAGIVGARTTVQCHHHQSLDRLGDGLRVVASAPDGQVEAVELAGADFVLGVQSHPEQDTTVGGADNQTVGLRLFSALVRQGRNNR